MKISKKQKAILKSYARGVLVSFLTFLASNELGLVRHALTFVGGILIAKGLASDGQVGEMIGAAITLVGTVWSVLSKKA